MTWPEQEEDLPDQRDAPSGAALVSPNGGSGDVYLFEPCVLVQVEHVSAQNAVGIRPSLKVVLDKAAPEW